MNIKSIRDLAELIYAYGDALFLRYLGRLDDDNIYVKIGKSKDLFCGYERILKDFRKLNPFIDTEDLDEIFYLDGNSVDPDVYYEAEQEYVINKIEEYLLEHFKEKE